MAFAVILVGMLGYVGYRYFREKHSENLRSAMQVEIAAVTHDALRYYKAPKVRGGGSDSFIGYEGVAASGRRGKKATRVVSGKLLMDTENAAYSLVSVSPDSVVFDGVGDPLGDDGVNPIKIRAIVRPDRVWFIIVN